MRALSALAVATLLAACASTSDSTGSADSTPVAATASTAEPEEVGHVFLLHDSGGSVDRPGPFLADVVRPEVVAIGDRIAALATVTPTEVAAGYTTAVPAGTRVRSATTEAGVATVDLSDEFASGGGAFSMSARLAQVVFTATAGPEWARTMNLLIDGELVSTFSSEGIELSQPLTRETSTDVLPLVLVEQPAAYEAITTTLSVSGLASVTDHRFRAELLDADRAPLAALPDIVTDGSGWGEFFVTVTIPEFEAGTVVILHVWDDSPGDSTAVGERYIPLTVAP